MKPAYYLSLLAMAGACSLFVSTASALSVNAAVEQFDQNVRSYNLISFGNTTIATTNDTQGGIAVQGNLTLQGGGTHPIANMYSTGADPEVYVNGQLKLDQWGILQTSNGGTISLPNQVGTTWNSGDKRLYTDAALDRFVQSIDGSNPTLNAPPAGWDFNALKSSFTDISTTLAAAATGGSFYVDGQTLKLKSDTNAGGVTVFSIDANDFSGSNYKGSYISGLDFDVPSNSLYVVNVLNANGKKLFGSVNDSTGTDTGNASRLLWNFSGTGTVTLDNNNDFYGSILASGWTINHTGNDRVTGQVVSGDFNYLGATELHYAAFTPPELPHDKVPDGLNAGLLLSLVIGSLGCLGRRRAF